MEQRTLLSASPVDVDNNGQTEVFTDGILIARSLAGFRGDSLIREAVADDAQRTDVASIERALDGLAATDQLDVDGNGSQDLFTDGILMARYMVGFRGHSLVQSAVTADATRTSASAVERYLDDLFATAGFAGLCEIDNFVTTVTADVEVGAATGRRMLRVELDAVVDESDDVPAVEDLFQIYLVDSNDPSTTLLDRGEPGTSLFTMAGDRVEMATGLVRFDGRMVEIDVSSVTSTSTATLLFQLLNSDDDYGTRVHIESMESVLDETLPPMSVAAVTSTRIVNAGPDVGLSGYAAATDVDVDINNVRFSTETGSYVAELRLHNTGDSTGRQLAVVFDSLPAGVSLQNASGTDSSGNPFANLVEAIPNGGLAMGAWSDSVLVEFSNPTLDPFSVLPRVLTAGPNQAPQFDSVGDLTVGVGGILSVPLVASDPDGDSLTFSLRTGDSLPAGELFADTLTFRPDVGDEGSYAFTLIASDGTSRIEQEVTLTVTAAAGNTRVSGVIQNVDQQPLGGVPIEVGMLSTVTAADGSFTIDVGSADPFPADVLRVIGTALTGTDAYPFIAEPLDLLLEREPIRGADNVIGRPIYLPVLDIAQADTVNPNQTTVIDAQLAPNEAPVTVTIAAGTLLDQSGNPFTGDVSITEVPRNRTPAALPDGMLPATVITVQPGEMVFTEPAAVTFPNRSDYEPGTELDLWSINHRTGLFEIVGRMRVSADGSTIETISGGIRNSSWHFAVPPPTGNAVDPSADDRNPDDACPDDCEATGDLTSRVEFFSGAVTETHDLVTYQSVGQSRGVRLVYDSLRADPRPIVHFGMRTITARVLRTSLILQRGDFVQSEPVSPTRVEQGTPTLAIPQPGHYWLLGAGDRHRAALQTDLSDQPSGVYQYFVQMEPLRTGEFPGATGIPAYTFFETAGQPLNTNGQVVSVNETNSPLGSGWGITGLQKIVENPDGSVLLIDGDGGEIVFELTPGQNPTYVSPPEDFSLLEKLPDGTFRRTTKHQTVFQFDLQNRLISETDRNNLVTSYDYDTEGRLTKITDPVQLETTFEYLNGQDDDAGQPTVSSVRITDPANRVTQIFVSGPGTQAFDNDGELRAIPEGNLFRITDPDGTSRTFLYDSRNHLTDEIDKRGFHEQTLYGFHGRATGAIRKDGTTIQVTPVAVDGLLPHSDTDYYSEVRSPQFMLLDRLPSARRPSAPVARNVDANGNVTTLELNRAGELVRAEDSVAPLPEVLRNDNNQISTVIDGRDNVTHYSYDNSGNLITIDDGATQVEWIANGAASWHVGANWSTGEVPGESDIVVIGGSSRFQVAITSDVTVAGLRFKEEGGSKTLGVLNGSTLTVNSPVVVPAGHAISLRDSTIVADIDNAGNLATTVTSTMLFNQIIGEFQNQPGAQILAGQGTTVFDRGFTNFGRIRMGLNLGATFLSIPNGTLVNSAIGTIDSVRLGLNSPVHTLNADIVNLGTIEVTTGELVLRKDLNNSGTVDVNGKLTLSSATVTNSASVNVAGTLEAAGSVWNQEAGLFEGNTATINDSTLNLTDGFTLTFDSLSMRNATINGDGVIRILSDATASLTNMSVPSNVNIDNYGELILTATTVTPNIEGGLNNRADSTLSIVGNWIVDQGFTNSGRIRLGISLSASSLSVTNGTLINTPEGRFENYRIGHNSPIHTFVGDIDNQGTIAIVTGELNLSGDVANSGTIDDGGGRINFFGNGVSNSGTVVVRNSIRGIGTYTQQQGGTLTVFVTSFGTTGRLDVGDATLAGTLDVRIQPNGSVNVDDQFQVLTYTNRTGEFETINGNGVDYTADYGATALTITANTAGMAAAFAAGQVFNLPPEPAAPVAAGWPGLERGTSKVPESHPAATPDIDRRFVGPAQSSPGHPAFAGTASSPPPAAAAAAANAAGTGIQTFTYDPTFNVLTSSTDELDRQTLFEIDPATGNRLSMTVVIGLPDSTSGETDDLTTTMTYTNLGLVDTLTDVLGRVTDLDYDAFGRVTRIATAVGTPDEVVLTLEYDNAGNVIAETDANNNRTEYRYDAMNNLIRVIDPDPDGPAEPLDSPETVYTYDEAGRPRTRILPGGATTTYDRNEMGQVIRQNDEGNVIHIGYDGIGNTTAITDPLGQTTRYEYNARYRQTAKVEPNGSRTEFSYDANNNLLSLIDAVGNETRYEYDARDRLAQVIDATGETTTYEYDAADRLIRQTDRNLRATEFVFDELDRPTTVTWLNADDSLANTLLYTYDDIGNLLTATDNNSSIALTYDSLNRVLTVDTTGPAGSPDAALTYTYDDDGNVLTVTDEINGQAGAVTGYEYDTLNQITSITQTDAGSTPVADKRVDFAYNELGQYTGITRFADLAGTQLVIDTAYEYDNLQRLTDLSHNNSTEAIAFYRYDYDAADRLTRLTDVDGVTDYSYDARDQLTAATHSNAANPDENYAWDETGNRVSSHLNGDAYQTGTANELLSDGNFTYDYDNEGNLIARTDVVSGTTRQFSYDHRNRLVRIVDTDSAATEVLDVRFGYDVFDRRISKSVKDAAGETTTYFVYDSDNVILDFFDADGSGPQPATLNARYLHGPDVDEVLAQETSTGDVQWLLADHLGTIRDVVSEAGELLNHVVYDSFGNIIAQSDPAVSSRYGYTGREYDAEVDLYYYRARYYDAGIGRFISRDPIGFAGTDANLYRYAGNQVTRFGDPFGLAPSFPGQNLRTEPCPTAFNPEDEASETCYDVNPNNPNADLEFGPGNQLLTEGITPRSRPTARRCGGLPDDPRGPSGQCLPRPDGPDFAHLPDFVCDTTFGGFDPPDYTERDIELPPREYSAPLLRLVEGAICDVFGHNTLNTCPDIDPDVRYRRRPGYRGTNGGGGVRG